MAFGRRRDFNLNQKKIYGLDKTKENKIEIEGRETKIREYRRFSRYSTALIHI